MPKMKTKSAAKKRFKVTATGKIKRACSGKNHILTKKDRNRKNNLSYGAYVHATPLKNVEKYLNLPKAISAAGAKDTEWQEKP